MDKYVVDTSVVTRFLVHQVQRELTQKVFHQAYHKNIELITSSLIWYELNNTFVVRGIPINEAERGMALFQKFIDQKMIQILPSNHETLRKAREIANTEVKGQGYISAYDATFHALALLKNGIFLTADRKHYLKTKELIGSVMLLEDFR